MKKLFILLGSLFILSVGTANAENIIKSYYAYVLKDIKIDTVKALINSAIQNEKGVRKLTGTANAYYLVYNDEHYYIKLYPAHKDTNIYIVADTNYDKSSNTLTEFFSHNNMKYAQLEDNAALSEYKFDFVDYARKGNLDGLFIMPDYIKPLKTGMGKLNDKMSKNSKKTSTIPYTEDNDPIDLTCVNSEHHFVTNAGVEVLVNEYRLKNKENKYVHAYEYLVKNNEDSTLHVNKVTSERLAGLKDITTQTFVDLDRLDLIDTIGTFPPVFLHKLFLLQGWK